MKRTSLSLLLLIVCAACDIERDSAGELSGMWHITAMEDILSGAVTYTDSCYRYWMFQYRLLRLRDSDGQDHVSHDLLLRYTHRNDTLIVGEPRVNDRYSDDPPLTDSAELSPFGITAMTDTFVVESPKASDLTLRSRRVIIMLEKF